MGLFDAYKPMLDTLIPVGLTGRVSGVRGLTVSVEGFPAPVGAGGQLVSAHRRLPVRVIGFSGEQTLVTPLGPLTGVRVGDRVVLSAAEQMVPVGESLLGRVLDAHAEPIDGAGPLAAGGRRAIWGPPLDPMSRRRITEPLATGVRAIDGLLTVGRGQRMGIFSASGGGKSVLMGMIARYTSADVNVIALIGERGREVRDFIERDLGPEGLRKSVVVVSTSDQPPLSRVQAAAVATAIAEHFRSRGADVLLLMDSLTRLAAAQRQIGLAAGEPPTTQGYPPSVFALLPELLERTGRTADGSITAFYSVLVEGDDAIDPVADAVRSVTDGHIRLSRELAASGQYPAIDVLRSVSRLFSDIADPEQRDAAGRVRSVLAAYDEIADLVNVGAYTPGANPRSDRAVQVMPWIREFLAQGTTESCTLPATRAQLHELAARILTDTPEPRRIPPTRPAAAPAGRRTES